MYPTPERIEARKETNRATYEALIKDRDCLNKNIKLLELEFKVLNGLKEIKKLEGEMENEQIKRHC
jgi:hypothetical protein